MLNGIMCGAAFWIAIVVLMLIGQTVDDSNNKHGHRLPSHIYVGWPTITWLLVFMLIGAVLGNVYDRHAAKQASLKPVKMYVQKIT